MISGYWVTMSRVEGDTGWRIDRRERMIRNREHAWVEVPKGQRWPAQVARMYLSNLVRKGLLSEVCRPGKKHVFTLRKGKFDGRWTGMIFGTNTRKKYAMPRKRKPPKPKPLKRRRKRRKK